MVYSSVIWLGIALAFAGQIKSFTDLFREDLYMRIAVLEIHLDPLNKRKEDFTEIKLKETIQSLSEGTE